MHKHAPLVGQFTRTNGQILCPIRSSPNPYPAQGSISRQETLRRFRPQAEYRRQVFYRVATWLPFKNCQTLTFWSRLIAPTIHRIPSRRIGLGYSSAEGWPLSGCRRTRQAIQQALQRGPQAAQAVTGDQTFRSSEIVRRVPFLPCP